ncbi:EAL domain-containing protein [Paraliobacillus sediminis]|uniref:EAL domain-containing protein n=1 Tax=Paraliobacillus sediminis TaxID=1885916 RepID=UPI0023DD8608|nr:EAL domain-containing protein [Paraliobacillus sediminis]
MGVLTPILDGFYYGNLLTGISNKAQAYNAKVVVFGTSASFYTNMYASDYVDGWIVIMDAVDDSFITKLRQQGKPIVGINTLLECDYVVSIDNEAMMESSISHLVKHGHNRIAYVGDAYFHDGKQRFDSYIQALKINNIPFKDDCFYNTLESSIHDIAKDMVENKLPFTAIVCVNDFTAMELIYHFKAYGLSIPADLAIIGFDDIPAAKTNHPSLSTIHLPVQEIAEQAAVIMFDILNGDNTAKLATTINTFPIFRSSCGCEVVQLMDENGNLTDTIEYLNKMVSRNFNLGQLMQSYNYKEVMEMNWLRHTPIERGLLGLWDENNKSELKVNQFIIEQAEKEAIIQSENCNPTQFPSREVICNEVFMQGENVMIVIPIIQDGIELGVFSFVGLKDINTQLISLNTTYQLANFFASALYRSEMNKELKSYSNQLELISTIMYDGIWEFDFGTKKMISRGGINEMLGYGIGYVEMEFINMMELIHPKDQLKVKRSFRRNMKYNTPFEVECKMRSHDGDYVWMYITGQVQRNAYGHLSKAIGSIMDISERKIAEERINELAYKDTLTGLSNRRYFEEELSNMLVKAKKDGSMLALILFDLDRFKIVNDSYGHQAGDRLLQYVAKRLRLIANDDYLIARLGGDEFVIAMPDVFHIEEAYNFGTHIVTAINQPFIDQEREYHISSSVGLSIYPDTALGAEAMILQADMAMYTAKSQGRNRIQVFSDVINFHNADRISLEKNLRKALEYDEFRLHYQPVYAMDTEEIVGVEALLRWESPVLGMVKPLDFIPLAEETGLIVSIGEWVLKQACLLNRRLEVLGSSIKMFVNISSSQLTHPDFVDLVKNILEETDCPPDQLCLEVTESIMIEDIDFSVRILKELIKLGIGISLDDFGTGYSSLSILKYLPIQTLKIDKSFIDDLSSDSKNSYIIKAIIDMSHSMSLEVVVEGVETLDQLQILKRLNVDYIQGFYMSRPLTVNKMIQLLYHKALQ